MRYLVVDTETTGLNYRHDRIIDFAAVPINGLIASIDTYQQYFNPECEVSPGSFAIHGLSAKFLKDYPTFQAKAKEIYEYMQGATLIIHNASFDMSFLNAEFARCGLPKLENNIIDTLHLARSKYPGKRASLDALCTRFNISIAQRQSNGHGALLDSQLLSLVYLKMITDCSSMQLNNQASMLEESGSFQSNITMDLTEQEQEQYEKFMSNLGCAC